MINKELDIMDVYCEDWHGLYIDGCLFYEGHHIEPHIVVESINEWLDQHKKIKLDEINFSYSEVKQDYVEECGLPELFSYISEEEFL